MLFRVCGPSAPLPGNHTSGERGADIDPRGAVDTPGSVGNVSELTPPPQILHPFSHLFPVPSAPPPSLSPIPFLSCAKLTETITKSVFVFPFEASCYARWVPPLAPRGPEQRPACHSGDPSTSTCPPPLRLPLPLTLTSAGTQL